MIDCINAESDRCLIAYIEVVTVTLIGNLRNNEIAFRNMIQSTKFTEYKKNAKNTTLCFVDKYKENSLSKK